MLYTYNVFLFLNINGKYCVYQLFHIMVCLRLLSLPTLFLKNFFLHFFKFIERERESMHMGGGVGRERERGRETESQAGSMLSVQSQMQGSSSRTMRS